MKSNSKIVVRMPNWIGDAVMAIPVIHLIKKSFPQSRVTIVGKPAILELFEADSMIDHRIVYDKRNRKEIIAQLKKEQMDWGILLTNSFSSAWDFFKARVKKRIGFSKEGRRILLTDSLPYEKDRTKDHHIDIYQQLLKKMGIEQKQMPQLFVSSQEKQWAKEFLAKRGLGDEAILIGVNPSAAFGSSKCWLEERYLKLSQKLLENKRVHLFFFGDASAWNKNNRIIQNLERCHNLAGMTTIRELLALTSQCHLFVTNDSGPMHIACALNVRTMAIFGSTSPRATGPYNKGKFIHKKVSCAPCFLRECPIDFRCMKAIEVDQVYQMALQELKEPVEALCPAS